VKVVDGIGLADYNFFRREDVYSSDQQKGQMAVAWSENLVSSRDYGNKEDIMSQE
jgi:hypothetical protein